MSTSALKSIDGNGFEVEYDVRRAKSECNKQTVYCIASISLFIAAGMLSSPDFVATIPGGELTAALLSVGIVVLVFLLCMWSWKKV